MRSSFSLYIKKQNGKNVWYARFYDPQTQKITATRSTGIECVGKKGRRKEAYATAQIIEQTLPKANDPLLFEYLLSFWENDSKYLKSKRIVEKKPLSSYYIESNRAGIMKHVVPYKPFAKLHLSEILPGHIEDWKLWAVEKGISPRRLNAILQAMAVPIRNAVSRGELVSDPFHKVKKAAYSPKEKGVLTLAEVQCLSNIEGIDPRIKLSVLLAALTGLRRGEVRGLQWGDIDQSAGVIHIKHNYVDGDGSKGCKWGSSRTVLLVSSLIPLLNEIRVKSYPQNSPNKSDYVFPSVVSLNEPCSIAIIRNGFTKALSKAGIGKLEQKKRNLTFHGLRHTFVTLARTAGIPDIIIQALAGHKSSEMMNHYSHISQVLDFNEARMKLEVLNGTENQTS